MPSGIVRSPQDVLGPTEAAQDPDIFSQPQGRCTQGLGLSIAVALEEMVGKSATDCQSNIREVDQHSEAVDLDSFVFPPIVHLG
jgi:hypothetical protein